MRHISERVPGKNHRPLAGKPLFHYILETLSAIDEVDLVVVDTDSPPVKAGIAETFPDVKVLERPDHLRGGTVAMNAVIAHDVEHVISRYYIQTHSTNPLLTPKTIKGAMARLLEYEDQSDSLFGVTRLQTRLWDENSEPINHDPGQLLRTQDLPPVFEENSCLYLFKRTAFLADSNRLSRRSRMFEIPAWEAWDIDDELDFAVVDCLIRQQIGLGPA
jgi:CMP-N-acetylneuraminic acid synthetase